MKQSVRTFWALALLLSCTHLLRAQCTDLFISEYVEGGSNNKCIEIYNPTGSAIDMDAGNYELLFYFNGNGTAGTTITLTATIAAGGTYVVCDDNASTAFTDAADLLSASSFFNGDDAVALVKNGNNLDVIGQIGTDPGDRWGTTTCGTENKTIRRIASVNEGDADGGNAFDLSEWDCFAQDASDGLGTHSLSGCSVLPTITFDVASASVDEDAGTYTITVTSSATGSHTADISVTGGTAPGADYSFSTVTATFASSTTFTATVTLNDNADNDCSRTVEFGLDGYSDASAGANTSLTLTINDDEAASSLSPGDLVFIGFDTHTFTGGYDKLVIMNTVEIGCNLSFLLANAVFEAKAAAGERTNRWYNGNDTNGNLFTNTDVSDVPHIIFTYTGGTSIPAGSVLCITTNGSGTVTELLLDGSDAIGDFNIVENGNVQFSSSDPDAIFLLQGDFGTELIDADGDSYRILNGTVLGGIQTRGVFQDFSVAGNAGGNRVSRFHPEIECFGISRGTSSTAFYAYYETSAPHSGSRETLLASIYNQANWTSSTGGAGADNIPICSDNFTITSSNAYVTWTGADDTNWFNCSNWDRFVVPDEDTDVLVPASASNDAVVDATADNSDDFGDIAYCRDLSITGVRVATENTGDVLWLKGNLSISGAGSLDLDGGAGQQPELHLEGNWTNALNESAFAEGEGTVYWKGSALQTMTNSGSGQETFHAVSLDNAAGLQLSGHLRIASSMAFVDGLVQTDASNLLIFNADATVSGASDASHANGPVDKETSNSAPETFTFPVGNGGFLGALGIETRNGLGERFRAQYFRSGYGSYAFNPIDLVTVSSLEYWNLSPQNSTGEEAKVTLHWGAHSDIVSAISDLRVGHWTTRAPNPGNRWESEGNTAVAGDPAGTGTVTSDWVGSFSPFTLSSFTGSNPLPVTWISFEAKWAAPRMARIEWMAEDPVLPAVYWVEKSLDGRHFEAIGSVASQQRPGGSAYAWQDAETGTLAYYRIRCVESDGYEQLTTVRMLMASGSLSGARAFPNPAGSHIAATWPSEWPVAQAVAIDMTGKEVARASLSQAGSKAYLGQAYLPLSGVPAGAYLLLLYDDAGQALWRTRFFKQ